MPNRIGTTGGNFSQFICLDWQQDTTSKRDGFKATKITQFGQLSFYNTDHRLSLHNHIDRLPKRVLHLVSILSYFDIQV